MNIRNWALVVIVAVIVAVLAGCQGSDKQDDFADISKMLAQHNNQLNDEEGVTLTGYAADPSKNVFKIGIGYDSTMTEARLKQIIEAYLSDSVSTVQESDWHQRLKPYKVIIERIGDVKTNFPIIAHKDAGEMDLTWE